ncbi:hypothetical protein D1AOALGA4SA_8072 [Olavius algarvensis Delta 1 endosymbiont]|nr:hypothetical protein D1AOALGA4SA_8072 [Olavius algarvensis Delta 1 endosymbiont]
MEYWVNSCSIWLNHNTVHGIYKPWIEKTSSEYINIHSEIAKIDPKSLDPNTDVIGF